MRPHSAAWGDGTYKSSDSGKTFSHMGLRDTHNIGSVVVHPTDPNMSSAITGARPRLRAGRAGGAASRRMRRSWLAFPIFRALFHGAGEGRGATCVRDRNRAQPAVTSSA